MENVPAVLYHEVFDAKDKFGRTSVPLEMDKGKNSRIPALFLQAGIPLVYASMSQCYNLTLK